MVKHPFARDEEAVGNGTLRLNASPVETALPVSSVGDAKRVVEAGSPTLEREPLDER